MEIWKIISDQFGKPAGFLGVLAGTIMSGRKSNVVRNKWVISLLNITSNDVVLEIGYGPGVAIQLMSRLVTNGIIYGLDHSEVMYRQAKRRNLKGIKDGRVKLMHGSASGIPRLDSSIDKVVAVNVVQFSDEPVKVLGNLRTIMTPGGTIALAHQPRKPGATSDDADKEGKKYAEYLALAGFRSIAIRKKEMKPVATVCVSGTA